MVIPGIEIGTGRFAMVPNWDEDKFPCITFHAVKGDEPITEENADTIEINAEPFCFIRFLTKQSALNLMQMAEYIYDNYERLQDGQA
jgi:hypothetical protein